MGKQYIYGVRLDLCAAASAASDIAARTLLDSVALATSDFTGTIGGGQKNASTPIVTQKFDRWGNVVEITDARNPNWVTKYKFSPLIRRPVA